MPVVTISFRFGRAPMTALGKGRALAHQADGLEGLQGLG